MSGTRDRVLDAYQELLRVEGERAATLDAVAAAAEVSKGGLIYHFASKELLAEALCERMLELVAADVVSIREAPEGAARHFVRTSRYLGTPLDHATIAVSRLHQAGYRRAEEALDAAQQLWTSSIQDEIGDPDVTRAVRLIGDGLYYEALLTVGPDGPDAGDDAAAEAALERLLLIVDRLTGRD